MKDISWRIKTKAVPYRAGTRFCDTCLSGKTNIALANPREILNSRKEIVSKCPHKRDFKLKSISPLEHNILQGAPLKDFLQIPA